MVQRILAWTRYHPLSNALCRSNVIIRHGCDRLPERCQKCNRQNLPDHVAQSPLHTCNGSICEGKTRRAIRGRGCLFRSTSRVCKRVRRVEGYSSFLKMPCMTSARPVVHLNEYIKHNCLVWLCRVRLCSSEKFPSSATPERSQEPNNTRSRAPQLILRELVPDTLTSLLDLMQGGTKRNKEGGIPHQSS